MEQYRFVSIKQIADNLAEHPLLKDISLERIVFYALRFMKIVGCPVIFENKVARLTYDNYVADIPCDLYKINQIKSIRCRDFCYRYTTDNFHLSVKDHDTPCKPHDFTYKIQNSKIYFSLKTDDIEISYQAIPVDSDNIPMIIDNESFIRALESYIKLEKFKILRDTGEIDRFTYASVEQDYLFDVAQASNKFALPSVDMMESITNMWTALLPRRNAHNDGFKAYSRKEILNRNL